MDDPDYIDEPGSSESEEDLRATLKMTLEKEEDKEQLSVLSEVSEEEEQETAQLGVTDAIREEDSAAPTVIPSLPLPEHASHNIISTLPYDILSIVVSHLSTTDLKHFRESGLRREEVICPHLFHRVSLSALKRDRDKLMAMAKAPHIARHVRTLEYVALEEWLLVLDEAYVVLNSKTRESAQIRDILDDCWLPVTSTREDVCLVWDAFRPFLERALDCMPALDRWAIIYGSAKAAQNRAPKKTRHHLRMPAVIVNSSGEVQDGGSGLDAVAREVLEQIMETRHHKLEPDEPASISVSRPGTGSAEEHTKATFFYCIPRADLQCLTKINLSLHLIEPEDMDWAVEQMLTAQRLQHLTVSSDLTWVAKGLEQAAMRDIGKKFLEAVTRQPDGWQLLEHFVTEDLEFPAAGLAKFARMHSQTLCSLHICEASLTKSHILALAAVEMPALSRFTAPSDDAHLCIPNTDVVFAMDNGPAKINSWEFNNVGGGVIVSVEPTARFPGRSAYPLPQDLDRAVLVEVKPFFTSWRFGPESYTARWKWGRQYPGGDVYYWRDDKDFLGSVATSTWVFLKGKGMGVYAEAPPVKWLEWTEERDYSPTPFGKPFRLFVDVQTASVGHRLQEGCGIPAEAILFEREHRDILVRKGVWPEFGEEE